MNEKKIFSLFNWRIFDVVLNISVRNIPIQNICVLANLGDYANYSVTPFRKLKLRSVKANRF